MEQRLLFFIFSSYVLTKVFKIEAFKKKKKKKKKRSIPRKKVILESQFIEIGKFAALPKINCTMEGFPWGFLFSESTKMTGFVPQKILPVVSFKMKQSVYPAMLSRNEVKLWIIHVMREWKLICW